MPALRLKLNSLSEALYFHYSTLFFCVEFLFVLFCLFNCLFYVLFDCLLLFFVVFMFTHVCKLYLDFFLQQSNWFKFHGNVIKFMS